MIVYVSPASIAVPVHDTVDPEVWHVPGVQAMSVEPHAMFADTTGAGLTVAGEVMVKVTEARAKPATEAA